MQKKSVGLLLFSVMFLIVYLPLESSTTTTQNNNPITIVSSKGNGETGNGNSIAPDVSADGRYVVFASTTGNLVEGDENIFCDNSSPNEGPFTDNCPDIFVYDRMNEQIFLVSIASDGTQANKASSHPVISADGRYVAFVSSANNLVAGDTNNVRDIFLHDKNTGETTRVSVASEGTEGNDTSFEADISGDGRYIAFFSAADNLVDDDSNGTWDVFVRDRVTVQTTRVSVASDGSEGTTGGTVLLGSFEVSISDDGQLVAFTSEYDDLVGNDTNGNMDVFVHNLLTGETRRVSVASDGSEGNGLSFSPILSANGQVIMFTSTATNLVDDGLGSGTFIHQLATGDTERVPINYGDNAVISADARYIAFSSSRGFMELDTNETWDVFLYDRQTESTVFVSTYIVAGNDVSTSPSISPDGKYIVFDSLANNLVDNDINGFSDVFIFDRDYVASYDVIIDAVNPVPPSCVLRNSPEQNERVLTLTGQNFPPSSYHVQFQRTDTTETTIHFGLEINWESSTQLSVDMSLIDEYLWADEKLTLRARLTDNNYDPVSDWSPQFLLADDATTCGVDGATPSPTNTLTITQTPTEIFTPTPTPTDTVAPPEPTATPTLTPTWADTPAPELWPDKPNLLSPANGARLVEGTAVTFEWSDAANVTHYASEYGRTDSPEFYYSGTQLNRTWTIGQQQIGSYWWHAEAYNDLGWSGWTDMWTFTIVPRPPINLTATNITCQQVELAWEHYSESTTEYLVTRSENGIGHFVIGATDTLQHLDFGVEQGKTFFYYVQAVTNDMESDSSNVIPVTVPSCISDSQTPTPVETPTPVPLPTATPTPTSPSAPGNNAGVFLPLVQR